MNSTQKIVIILGLIGLAATLLFIPFTHESTQQVVSGSVPIWELGVKDTVDFRSLGIVWFCIVATASMLWFLFSKAPKLEKFWAAAGFLSALFVVVVVIEKSRLVPRLEVERIENKSSGHVEFAYSVTFESGRYRVLRAQPLSRMEMIQVLKAEGKLNRFFGPADPVTTMWLEFKSKIFPELQAEIAGPSHMALERHRMEINRLMHPTCAAIGSIMPWTVLLSLTIGSIYWWDKRQRLSKGAPKAELNA
jgi:hypothetical protein